MKFLLLILISLILLLSRVSSENKKPNILFFIVDDLGWGNVGFHREHHSKNTMEEILTPNLDEYSLLGMKFNRHYVHGTCTPTRSSFFSGRLPVHVQTSLAGPEASNSGIPRYMTTFPSLLKSKGGYTTHMIGKWDAGFASFDHTPKGRGFDTSLIYTEHGGDYWNYNIDATSAVCGYYDGYEDLDDLWKHGKYGSFDSKIEEGSPACEEMRSGIYEEYTLRNRALQFLDDFAENIANGNEDKPFYLNYASHLMHQPIQIPKDSILNSSFPNDHWMCSYGTGYVHDELSAARDFECRKLYNSMVNVMDNVFGDLMNKLKSLKLWENTLVVFTSDNGGSTWSIESAASNYPLRGGKYSDWEGGIRSTSFVSGGYLPTESRGKELNEMIHVSDWFATFSSLANIPSNEWRENVNTKDGEHNYPPIDSHDIWPVLTQNAESPHKCIHVSQQTLICDNYKYTIGNWSNSGWPDVIYPTNFRVMSSSTVYEIYADCNHGCLFDIVHDFKEENDLGKDPKYGQIKNTLSTKLLELNKSFWVNSDTHARDSCPLDCTCGHDHETYIPEHDQHNMNLDGDFKCIPCGCWMSKYRWGNVVGPYQDIDHVPTCDVVEKEYIPQCGISSDQQTHAEL